MPNPVTVVHLESRWRPLSPAEEALATLLLADAWAVLNARVPNLDARTSAVPPEPLLTGLLIQVETAMVRRVMSNPDGIRQESVGQWSYTRDQSLSSGALFVSAEELDLLLSPGQAGDAYSIIPFGEPGYSPVVDSWL